MKFWMSAPILTLQVDQWSYCIRRSDLWITTARGCEENVELQWMWGDTYTSASPGQQLLSSMVAKLAMGLLSEASLGGLDVLISMRAHSARS